jgi:nucleoside phosphorylase
MAGDLLTLIVMNKQEKDLWCKDLTYESYSPRHDSSISFIKGTRVAATAPGLNVGTRIRVSGTASVSDVIALARACFKGYELDFEVTQRRADGEYGHSLRYALYYPALSGQRLEESATLSDYGIVDGDLLLVSQETGPRLPTLTMTGVQSFSSFQQMVWGTETPYDPMLLAALLYTESDIQLARYVREHFDEIHQMSGPRVITYVVERPPQDRSASAPQFWKSRLDVAAYHAWSLLGWTNSKPYDKSAAYEIATSLGIYPDQLPCLAVFAKAGQREKVVIPVSGDYTAFFRTAFSNIQRALGLGPGPDIWDEEALDEERLGVFEKLRQSLSPMPADEQGRNRAQLFDQTVFVNGRKREGVLLVTATDVEFQTVVSLFRSSTGREAKPVGGAARRYLELGSVNGSRVFLAPTGMGSGGLGGSQESVGKAIDALSPAVAVLVGIAFGIDEKKQKIGDVLVSERLMPYELQRRGTGPDGATRIVPRGSRPDASPSLVESLRVAHLTRPSPQPRVRFGLLLSGEKLVDNIDFRSQLLALAPEAIGGEMEGSGFYVACQDRKVDWVVVKAICDWADGKKAKDKTSRQRKAALNSASFLLDALCQAPLE